MISFDATSDHETYVDCNRDEKTKNNEGNQINLIIEIDVNQAA
jgi:hypothetical protein